MNIISVQPITDRPIIDAIAPDDFMLIGDASDNNIVKRVLLSTLKAYFANQPITPTAFALRINCGGEAYIDTFGNSWQANTYQTDGDVYTEYGTTLNDPNRTLYLSQAYYFAYTIPVPNGSYTVDLHFLEIDPSAQTIRFFDVLLNGQIVLPNYSIFNDAGFLNPVIKSFPVTISNGLLMITSNAIGSKSPMINAIAITEA